jgi:ligand-binding sensor domain-containing protein
MRSALALVLFAVAAPASAQPRIESVITATADARDIAVIGERTLIATEGGLLVVRGGVLERALGPRDGLPGARMRSVSVTDDGVWVSGVEGTVMLDGDDLHVVHTLPLRRVRRVVRFAGQTWLASFGDGLHRWDGRTLEPVELGRAHAYVRLTDLIVRGEEVWVASSGVGILRVGADARVRGRIRERDGLRTDYVWRLIANGDRTLALTIDGVSEIDAGGAIDREGAITRSAQRLPVRDVRAAFVQGDDVWLATFGQGLWRARIGERPRRVASSIAEVNAIAGDPRGLIVAHSGGVHLARGDRAEPIAVGGLPSGDITSIARAFGSLWVGTYGQGLARMRGEVFEAQRSAHERWSVDRRVNDLARTGRGGSERLWIATDRGVFWHDGRIFSRVDDPDGPGIVHATSLHVDRQGALWVTTTQKFCRARADRWRCWRGEDSFAQLHAVTTDARGRVWVGSLHGLYLFDPARGSFDRRTVSSGDLPVDWVTALIPWGDGVMAGTYHGGLSIGDGSSRFHIVREGDGGLPSGWVNPHALDRVGADAWIGTLERGLVIGRPGAWQQLTRANGLPSDDVTDVLVDGDAIWIATRGGLARAAR